MADEGFSAEIKQIKTWDKTVRTELRKELRTVGTSIAAGSRTLASAHSKSIPPTIRVRTRTGARKAQIEITAGSGDVPLAGLYEFGNKGRKAKAGKFRHPVFGDPSTWVSQQRWRFLSPIIHLRHAYATKKVEEAVKKANETIAHM